MWTYLMDDQQDWTSPEPRWDETTYDDEEEPFDPLGSWVEQTIVDVDWTDK